jgi:hypothetical protein
MTTIYVKSGTPPMSVQSKCESCMHAQILRGFRESEEIVYCTASYGPPLAIPFKVYQCTSHMGRTRPTWKQMEDLAIDILPISSTRAKPAGFRAGDDSGSTDEVEDEPEPEPVNR